jgi:D-alanine-D-alanine ligase
VRARRVAVLAGGRSSEHEVSLVSAAGVAGALRERGHDVTAVLIDREGAWSVDGAPVALVPGPDGRARLASLGAGPERAVDVVFPVLHGPFGEDGTVQGLCEMARVPYVGAGVAASAIAMDKALFKVHCAEAGIPTPEWVGVEAGEWEGVPDVIRSRIAARVGYPVFVKPARLGSSVGISKVAGPAELDAALELAFAHDPKALVERAIRGREVEVGVLGGRPLTVSPPGEIVYDADWYDYETKYEPGRAEIIVPAALPGPVAERARALARRAFEAIDCQGMARVDFFVEEADETVLVSELNTIPGFTPTSAYTSLMAAGGVPYGELVDRLVDLALERAAAAERFRA